MNKTVLVSVFFLLLAGCSEKDKIYYAQHLEEAEAKTQECREELRKATLRQDRRMIDKMKNDVECHVADEVLKEAKKLKEEKERLEREAKIKAELEREQKRIGERYGKLTWQEFIATFAASECAKKPATINDKGKDKNKDRDYECRAMEEMYKQSVKFGKAQLTQVPYEKLLEQKGLYCVDSQTKPSACEVWNESVTELARAIFDKFSFNELLEQEKIYCEGERDASHLACRMWAQFLDERKKNIVKQYMENYDKLKTDYNACVDQVDELRKEDKWEEIVELSAAYPCKYARDARIQLKLGYDGFKNKLK